MVELGAIRIFPFPGQASAKRNEAPFPLGRRAASGREPAWLHRAGHDVDNRHMAETTALPVVAKLESGLSAIVRSRGAVARIACIKPAMRVDNR
jgi:hypothetical protein